MNFVFQQQSFDPIHAALFTDLYELTMVQAYWAHRMNQPATFEIFFRTLPENRNFVLASGLEDVLAYLENLQFRDDDIAYLKNHAQFQDDFIEWLKSFRFAGDVYAVPEGTVVFANEPILQIVAPRAETELIET